MYHFKQRICMWFRLCHKPVSKISSHTFVKKWREHLLLCHPVWETQWLAKPHFNRNNWWADRRWLWNALSCTYRDNEISEIVCGAQGSLRVHPVTRGSLSTCPPLSLESCRCSSPRQSEAQGPCLFVDQSRMVPLLGFSYLWSHTHTLLFDSLCILII